jgi:hypothetical protein
MLSFVGNKNLLMGKKRKKKRKKNSFPKGPDQFSAATACGWAVFELPLHWWRCHRAATGLHRGVLLLRRTAE